MTNVGSTISGSTCFERRWSTYWAQVIPSSGEWASDLVGRKLNLLDPYDNAAAGIAIIRSLVRTSDTLDIAIASYYQGQYSVTTHGMYPDTKAYVKAVKAHMKNFS